MLTADSIARIIVSVFRFFSLIVILKVLLSYFMSPYHPVRQFVDRLIDPLLAPIRRILPPIASIDFSPLVLIILLQVVEMIILRLVVANP